VSCALNVTADNWRTYVTIEFLCKVESHEADDDADKGKHPCGDIHDKRPSPWPPTGVDLPLEIEGGEEFPSIPRYKWRRPHRRRENVQVNAGTNMYDF
jgi:hypothetical protein